MIYTLVGSLLMLVAAVATGILATPEGGQTTFVIQELARAPAFQRARSDWIFLFFAAAFLVKMPAFPLHAWMPDAYRAAPTPVLAVLSGVLSKVGAYGFLRIALPLFPDASVQFQELMLADRGREHPLRLGDGVHAELGDPRRRVLVDRAARVHHARDLRAARRGRAGRQ